MPICGAKTKDGKQCQSRVSEAGQRCHRHSRNQPKVVGQTILKVCTTIATIAEGAQGIQWIYQHAWPYIEKLVQSGLYSPETFWWDSLAAPYQRRESTTQIHSKLERMLRQMRGNEKGIEDRLARHSESDRARIADAYAKVLSEIRMHYPHLANAASSKLA
jgi:molybdenum-dependent DNA-binding transcriptional regulator ModE